jgi:hypothetical protein
MHQRGDVSAVRLNQIIQKFEIRNYLEIGIATGETFRNINVQNKIGCDPNPKLNTSNRNYIENGMIFSLKSDEFFALDTNQEFELVFIDGLHTADQVSRDFVNSLKYSNEKTIWLIDDVFPDCTTSEKISLSKYRWGRILDFGKSLLSGKRLPVKIGWQGDVWKFVKALSTLDDFKIATIFHSDEKVQSVIWINKKIFEVPEKEFNLYTTFILKHLLDSIGAEKSSIRNYLGFDRDMWNEELENLILPDFYFPVSNTDEVFNKINLKEM